VLAPDEKRRDANPCEFSPQVAVREEHSSPHDVERAGTQRVADDRRKLPAQLVERRNEAQALSKLPSTARDPRRSDERQATNTLWLCCRQLGRDQPAERMTDQIDLLESNRAEPPAEPHDEIGRAHSPP
jgi:hypothetical protein